MSKTTEILKALGLVGAGYALGKGSKSSGGNDEISKIIKSYDHDLTPIELETAREMLSDPQILHAFKQFTGEQKKADETLKAQAEQKLNNIERQNANVGSHLKGFPVFINYERRVEGFYQFIVDHSEAEVIRIVSEIQKSSMSDFDKSAAIIKALVPEMTYGEDGAYGVWKYLNRKNATQGASRLVEWAKKRQK